MLFTYTVYIFFFLFLAMNTEIYLIILFLHNVPGFYAGKVTS